MSAAYTWRKSTDLTATQLLSGYYWYSWIGVTSADYQPGTPVTAATASRATPLGAERPRSRTPSRADTCSATGPTSAHVQRPRARHGEAAVEQLDGPRGLHLNDWTEHVGPDAILNPNHYDLDAADDGAAMVIRSAGSGKNYYRTPSGRSTVNGLYQLPAGFEIAGNVFGRQGYPEARLPELDAGALDGNLRHAGGRNADRRQIRLPDLWNVDLRLAKNFKFGGGRTNVTLSAEMFNVLNSSTRAEPHRRRGLVHVQPAGRDPGAAHRPFRRAARVLDLLTQAAPGEGPRAPGAVLRFE